MPTRPTVGRIVHYRNKNNTAPLAAIVVAVPEKPGANDENKCTVQVFTETGGRFAIELIEGQRHDSQKEWWEWPPRDPAA